MSNTIPQDTPLKQCTGPCQQFFPATSEFFYSHSKGKLRPDCKECVKAAMQRKRDAARPSKPIIPEGYKQCFTCKKIKPATREFFYTHSDAKDGLRYQCKECISAYDKSHYTPKREPRPIAREGYKVCRICGKECPATIEYFSPHQSTYDRLKHECRACCSLWGKQHHSKPEVKIRAKRQAKIWEAGHKEQRKAIWHRRRASQMTIPGTYTPEQIREQYDRQKGRCYYCGKKVKWGEHTIDHTFPVSRVVGMNIPANDISYLVIACKPCNTSKGNKYPWEWPEGGRLL